MNYEESQKLKVGSRVLWKHDPKDIGTVIEVGSYFVKIKWKKVNQIGNCDRRGLYDVSFPPSPMNLVRDLAKSKSSY